MSNMNVVKRSGVREPLDFTKIENNVLRAMEGVSGVNLSDVLMNLKLQFYDGITSKQIDATTIKAAEGLITVERPNYDLVAGRLHMNVIRKEALGQWTPMPILELVKRNVALGLYHPDLLTVYSEEEYKWMDSIIDHDRDYDYRYGATVQWREKYLIQNRANKTIAETPQYAYMLMAAMAYSRHSKDDRRKHIREFYEVCEHLNLPTPIMAGLRSTRMQYSSCTTIECEDTLPSIGAAAQAMMAYVADKAGIGGGVGSIRAEGDPIRTGDAVHTGVTPFYRLFQAAIKSCSQGGVRGGAGTLFAPIWHKQMYDTILVLRNNRGTEDNRVRRVDYGIQWNRYLLRRCMNNEQIPLFSPAEKVTPGLYQAFFKRDQSEFVELYEKYEKDPSVSKTWVNGGDLLNRFLMERAETGRIYSMMVDEVNEHTTFDVPIRQSNLCMEITLPTEPVQQDPNEGLISLCILMGYDLAAIKGSTKQDFDKVLGRLSRVAVRFLNALIDIQEYLRPEAKRATMLYRSLGIGVINFAQFLAKRKTRYGEPEALKLTHQLFEAMAWHTWNASVELAAEQGACPGFQNTRMAKGELIIDTYNRSIDEFANFEYQYDWEDLRERVLKYGTRNAAALALMPAETSSVVSNGVNGIERVRELITIKGAKDGVFTQAMPELDKLAKYYDLAWECDNESYLKTVAVMQKFVDQAISTNFYYDPVRFPGGMVPMKQIRRDWLLSVKWGIKNTYYHNTFDHSNEQSSIEDDGCGDGGCKL